LTGVPSGQAADGLATGSEIPIRLVGRPTWGQAMPAPGVTATVADDVRSGNRIVVPRGSEVRGQLVDAPPSPGDPMRRRLVFSEVVIHGKVHRLSAQPVTVVLSVTRTPYYCGTPTLHGEPPFKLGELVELSLPAGSRWTVRLTRPLELG
jgi:hypothetical protein